VCCNVQPGDMLHVEAYLNNDLCEDLELEIQRDIPGLQ
jgi:hypothetical protein